jgi:hypothetical protein
MSSILPGRDRPFGPRLPRRLVAELLGIAGPAPFARPGQRGAAVLVFAVAAAACGGRRPPAAAQPQVVSSVGVGECAEPEHAGVVGPRPRFVAADRDLGGGPQIERIVDDKSLCDRAGNCHWNVFVRSPGQESCIRYAGTLSASALEPMSSMGAAGMRDIRAYWTLASGRTLVQDYRFSRGGYRVLDALLCRSTDDDRLECVEEAAR